MEATEKRLLRSEVPDKLTWDLRDLFQTDEDWEKELKAVQESLSGIVSFKGQLGQDSQKLLNCLNELEALQKRVIRVSTYASLRQSADGTDPVNQGNSSKVAAMLAKVNADLSFISSEILDLPDGTVDTYLKENNDLQKFSKYLLDILETKPYKLSPDTEKALASLGEVLDAPYTVYQFSKSSDMQFDSIQDDNGNVLPMSFALFEDRYELVPDTNLRRKAYDSFVNTLKQYKNTFGANYATEVKKQVALARLRNYESVTHMLLAPQQVSLDMYHNQLDIIQKELAPHMRKFAKLKKEVLGLDTMRFCDLKAPLDPEFNPTTTYEEASETILSALSIMGDEYNEAMKKALTERWVDLADNVGKSTGAFCSSPYGVHPYILITWTDTMRGAFILAHELGHAGHFYMAGRNQDLVNTRPSMYCIEAPSTINELILGEHILSKAEDPRMKRWVILQLLGTYYHNFVTHLLEAEFQRRVYDLAENGTPLTASVFCEQKANVLKDFWGDTVEIDEGASLTWMRQPHYYMGLYPYTYSAGLTVATAAAQMIKDEGQPAVDRWLELLKAGGTLKPLDLIKISGVDMSKPDAIRKAVAYVGSLIDELEKSYN
ncbi:oligoendopeptidase F [Lederbergia wuyishanensis]|uniref:Oligopeptidase F n=1 Tax=Lederbergia wuyishanensis TaxID=1347903 RepID=A0ABU0D0L2_9BACI|nr:oligoendopeptidase F [Lederbergia wuyishanensis]MCJ8006562.1 oligoendopeptidase F [Lederbergia wuyishanensis]MDQ0341941.1 oligoendopeptidase F [Lederbergia wuyishanensis]